MGRSPVVTIKPKRIDFGDVPTHNMIMRANLRCNPVNTTSSDWWLTFQILLLVLPECSMARARMRPPKNMKFVDLR